MIRHILQTLHISSQPMRVLRRKNSTAGEYLSAMKDVFLAVFYLLVLFKILRLVSKFVKVLLVPLKMMGLVAWWFAFG